MPIVKFQRRMPRFAPYSRFPTLPAFDDFPGKFRKIFDETFDFAPFTQPISFVPPMEIVETPVELTLTAELPGMTAKDVEINFEDGTLFVRGEKVEEKEEGEEKKEYYLWERNYGAFQRAFTLPFTVDIPKVVAEFKNGVLKVHMPKTSEAKAKGRKIEIAEK